MAHIYKYKHISNASNHYQCLQVVRALMTKTPVKLEAMLGHWVDFLLSMSFCVLQDLNASPHCTWHEISRCHLGEKSLFFKDWRIKPCPAECVPQERSEAPPCHALPQEADCFLVVPFGILKDFFISFFTFSLGFLLSSAKHRQTNSCSKTKENLIPTQWDFRVGLGYLLICAEIRTFVCSPHPPYYRESDKLQKSHRLTHLCSAFGEHFCAFWCLLLLQEISMDFTISPEGPTALQTHTISLTQ